MSLVIIIIITCSGEHAATLVGTEAMHHLITVDSITAI